VPNESPFPVEIARDLLGLARALYLAFVERGPAYDEQRWKLRGIGGQLQLAIERGQQGGPGTLANRCDWLIAEKAAKDLGELVGEHFSAKTLLRVTAERMARKNRD
jgi:hypothetical protein